MTLGCEHQDTYGETSFYTISVIIFLSHKYSTLNPAVQMYISPFQFSTINEDTKQMSEHKYNE
jgi:hypothetical protein